MRASDDAAPATSGSARVDQLRRAEAIIVRLRWLAMASWPLILATTRLRVAPRLVWCAWAVGVAYTATTHWLNRGGRAVRATAVATTVLDPLVTAMICALTGGLDSRLYPFFYLTTLATSIRFGMRETLATVGLTAALSAALLAAPGSTAGVNDLGLAVFYLLFVAIEGGLLSRAAREHSLARRDLLWRLIGAHEDERRRLAAELHDRVGHRFFGLHRAVEAVRTAAARAAPELTGALDDVGDATRACGDEIRAVTNVLRPVVLDEFGFVEALREHVAALAADATPVVTLAVDIADAGAREPHAVGAMLFRVLQEALLNVRKHAHAATVTVSYAVRDGTTTLAVRDDGRGFDAASVPRGHLGLLFMRERVEACGGRLDVRSGPGSGTEVRVTVAV